MKVRKDWQAKYRRDVNKRFLEVDQGIICTFVGVAGA
jgi:hypothetical protein